MTGEPQTLGEILDRLPEPKEATMAEAHALEKSAARQPVALPDTIQPGALLGAIVTLAKDPAVDVSKLDAILKMQERMEDRQAERTFITAYADLSKDLPRVKKNGTISLGNKGDIPFAKWEDMDRVIRPLMAKNGFTLSFDSAPRSGEGGGLVVTGTLMHRDGHTRTASMPLPLDTGPGRNNLQAAGSTLSYGKRYCAEMLLNIVREGADDDGAGSDMSDLITAEEKAELVKLIKETSADTAAFLKYVFPRDAYTSIDEIPHWRFPDAKAALEKKKRSVK